MRGDGTNGWRSLKDIGLVSTPISSLVPPPGVHNFNQVVYPPLAHSFGLRSACFMESYRHHPISEKSRVTSAFDEEQVFTSRESFLAWELCAELRSNVDYLVELNEMLRYNDRRRKRGLETLGSKSDDADEYDSVDFLQLLTPEGQDKVLVGLLKGCGNISKEEINASIQRELNFNLDAASGECEKILVVIAVLSVCVLSQRNRTINETECASMGRRPWLRHMWWDGCLAYILWDIIPILERCNLYNLAVASLQVLLTGLAQDSSLFPAGTCPTRLAPLLLSRRARGKAYDRLVIDLSHLHRNDHSSLADESQRKQLQKRHASNLVDFCKATVNAVVESCYISFSSIRGLARRLKRPLSTTLHGKICLEAKELGLRLENDTRTDSVLEQGNEKSKQAQKYVDWEAITDRFVANALTSDDANGPGSRCSFVGFEEDKVQISESLNVEQLAMELYYTGRLPANDSPAPDEIRGGWVGWHDEGGNVRALFRILCAAPVLGMDWGCGCEFGNSDPSVHLSPYQSAPFDLHVGFHSVSRAPNQIAGFYVRRRIRIESFLGKLSMLDGQELCDLVYDSVLARLQYMVHHNRKDPSLDTDVRQVRTLSLIAAGCGGKQLASIFRCLFFDYRHYSGGLPDLLMVRAKSVGSSNSGSSLVDLGGWVGEGFARENVEARQVQQAYAMLSDRDEEFLGCGKVGDSGGSTSRSSRQQRLQSISRNATGDPPRGQVSLESLPDKLRLVVGDSNTSHGLITVKVECMMVEVKSSNDRLDPRQEDWLNILDRHGNARVCKFEDTRKKQKKIKPAVVDKGK